MRRQEEDFTGPRGVSKPSLADDPAAVPVVMCDTHEATFPYPLVPQLCHQAAFAEGLLPEEACVPANWIMLRAAEIGEHGSESR